MWQRSLVVYLAGSESVSSMIVVLAFMAGLGSGALWMGHRADRVRNPAGTLAAVELGLACVNLAVLGLLALDPGAGMLHLQRLALSFGVPLRVVYAAVSATVLLGPCFLMGVTSPLISEVAQRQLRAADNRILLVLFCTNTAGSFAGGVATGFLLMPLVGQRRCLLIAIALNALTAALLVAVARRPASAGVAPALPAVRPAVSPWAFQAAGFLLGLLALGYEMYLYRAVALSFEPKPYTFATVLCLFLLLWAIGILLARWASALLALTLTATAVATLVASVLATLPWPDALDWRSGLLALLLWLPCLGFGAAFGQLVVRLAVSWGDDVGRFYGWNTLGSCCGIVLGVLVGYRVHPAYMALAISLGYLGLAAAAVSREPFRPGGRHGFLLAGSAALGLWTATLVLVVSDQRTERAAGTRTYYGPEGVIEVRGGHDLFWNGLGHAPLSRGDDHVGNNNWLLAAVPLLAHAPGRELEALVVGLGGGTTVGTLARSGAVRSVDVYDLEPDLARLLADFPEGTLDVGTDPKVRIFWGDGRTGLALVPRRYDVITQQPLYLKQAGSSLLLSKEYLRLVRSRLKPGGTYCIYSNAQGHAGQAAIVRRTAREVFPYCESIARSYMLIVSDQPFSFDAASIRRALEAAGPGDRLAAEVRRFGVEQLAALLDRPRLDWDESPVAVTDDRPIVEYPGIADRLVAASRRARAR